MRKYFLLIILGLPGYTLMAQIDHYWSWNFNTSSALLSGAVVGGKPDVSSIFYNPALIAKTTEESQFAVNASLFTIEWLNHENAFGNGFDAKKEDLKLQPRFISYTGDTKKGAKFEFAYFTRNADKLKLVFNHKMDMDILSQPQGEEVYTAQLQFKSEYTDRWFGFGISDVSKEKFSYGLSTFVSVKDLRYELERSMLAFSTEDSVLINGILEPAYVASYSDRELIRTWDGRILWKGGIHYQLNRWGFGLAITTPSIHVVGNSNSTKEVTRVNIFDAAEDQRMLDSAFVSFQSKKQFQIKDPLAISFGLAYKNPRNGNGFLISAEYFHEIKPYQLTDADETNSSTTNSQGNNFEEPERINVYHGANSVLNLAIGYHYYINENISMLGGLRTDFSNIGEFKKDNPMLWSIAALDYGIYHITFGGEFKIRQLDFVAGIEYSRAREDNKQQVINFSDPLEYIPTTGEALQGIQTNTMNVNYNALSLFIGLTYNILKGNG